MSGIRQSVTKTLRRIWAPLALYIRGRIVRYFIVGPSRSLTRRLTREYSRNLRLGLERRALEDTLDYLEENMLHVVMFPNRRAIEEFALTQVAVDDGLVLEFGVATGKTINTLAAGTSATVYGFDSFEGLQENWGIEFGRGSFRQPELPEVAANVELVVGYFNDTLPGFVAKHGETPISLLHVDCDLYSSTVTVLTELQRQIVTGTVVLFDEYFNYPGWRQHEYRAWQEFCRANNVRYEYLAATEKGRQALVRVVGVGSGADSP